MNTELLLSTTKIFSQDFFSILASGRQIFFMTILYASGHQNGKEKLQKLQTSNVQTKPVQKKKKKKSQNAQRKVVNLVFL